MPSTGDSPRPKRAIQLLLSELTKVILCFYGVKVHSGSISSNHSLYSAVHNRAVPSSVDDFIYEIVLRNERNESETPRHREQMKSAIKLDCTIQISLRRDAKNAIRVNGLNAMSDDFDMRPAF